MDINKQKKPEPHLPQNHLTISYMPIQQSLDIVIALIIHLDFSVMRRQLNQILIIVICFHKLGKNAATIIPLN